jgi:hypothetical protein
MTTNKANTSQSELAGTFTREVGSTLFKVNIYFDEAETERLEDKLIRLMKNDLDFGSNQKAAKNDLTSGHKNAIMAIPQADWSPERGSV